jgi:hypothetical protein
VRLDLGKLRDMESKNTKRLRAYQATYILHGAKIERKGAFKNYGEAIRYFKDLGAKIINLHFAGWESGWALIKND